MPRPRRWRRWCRQPAPRWPRSRIWSRPCGSIRSACGGTSTPPAVWSSPSARCFCSRRRSAARRPAASSRPRWRRRRGASGVSGRRSPRTRKSPRRLRPMCWPASPRPRRISESPTRCGGACSGTKENRSMPLLTLGTRTCYYRLSGRDDRPALILSHSLGQDHGMWDPQIEALAARFRVLRYDTRGHGAADVVPGDYRIEQLGADVLALADGLGIARFAFCGLSLGGMIGLWLATHAPHRVAALVLANTSPRPDAETMGARPVAVLSGGIASVVDTVMGRVFSPRLPEIHPPPLAHAPRTLLSPPPGG